MSNAEEKIANLTKYLKKLQYLILNDSKFRIFGQSYVDTRRLDDLFCCVEASWPEEYTSFLTRQGDLKLKTPSLYKKLKAATKNKFVLSDEICVVREKDAIDAINSIMMSIKKDLNFIKGCN